MRNIRRDANGKLERAEKDAEISEDDLRRAEAEIQKLTDAHIKELDEASSARKPRSWRSEGSDSLRLRSRRVLQRASAPPRFWPSSTQRRPDSRRHHHGRQRPLGLEARPARHRGAQCGRQGGSRSHRRRRSSSGIDYLTIYSFSSENWSRPEDEVSGLMRLFVEVLEREVDNLMRMNVRVQVIGLMDELPSATREAFERVCAKTAENTGLTLVVALNYGARAEILAAAVSLASDVAARSGRARRDRRGSVRRAASRPSASPIPTFSSERAGSAHQQLPALADRLQRAVDHQRALAGLRSR